MTADRRSFLKAAAASAVLAAPAGVLARQPASGSGRPARDCWTSAYQGIED
jgi:hypothetical protein